MYREHLRYVRILDEQAEDRGIRQQRERGDSKPDQLRGVVYLGGLVRGVPKSRTNSASVIWPMRIWSTLCWVIGFGPSAKLINKSRSGLRQRQVWFSLADIVYESGHKCSKIISTKTAERRAAIGSPGLEPLTTSLIERVFLRALPEDVKVEHFGFPRQ